MALSTAAGVGKAQSNAAYVDEVNRQNKLAFEMSQKAREAERKRQREFEQEQHATVDQTTDAMTRDRFEEDKEANALQFMEILDTRPQVLNEAARLSGQEAASDAVKEDMSKRAAKEAADTRERLKALASLTGYGTTGQNRALTFADAADDVSTVSGLRRGSLSVSQQEQQIPAATVHRPDTTFLDILGGVGGMMGSGMFGGLNVPGAATAAAPAASIRPMMNPLY